MLALQPLAPEQPWFVGDSVGTHRARLERHAGQIDDRLDEQLVVRLQPADERIDPAGRGTQSGGERHTELVVDRTMKRIEPPGGGVVDRNLGSRLGLEEVRTFGQNTGQLPPPKGGGL